MAQVATYAGYERNHGIKFQGVVLPNAIIGDLWCPISGRCHAGHLMSRSRPNGRLRDGREGQPSTTLMGTLPMQSCPT
ncbi:unnamed protein product [Discosporangium mesarthrocarpum]